MKELAHNISITIRRPWWAFWRRNKTINMPNAKLTLSELIEENGMLKYDVELEGLPTEEALRKILNEAGIK